MFLALLILSEEFWHSAEGLHEIFVTKVLLTSEEIIDQAGPQYSV